jgi:hypothetical protein
MQDRGAGIFLLPPGEVNMLDKHGVEESKEEKILGQKIEV